MKCDSVQNGRDKTDFKARIGEKAIYVPRIKMQDLDREEIAFLSLRQDALFIFHNNSFPVYVL